MKKKYLFIALTTLLVFAAVWFFAFRTNGDDEQSLPSIKVTRGTITDKALAVGTIEPENEISVKSKISGVVKIIFVEPGTFVHAGDPLLEVKPDPTPLELADAKRQVELEEVQFKALQQEKVRQVSLKEKGLTSEKEYEEFIRQYNDRDLRVKIAKERLALIESGKVAIGKTEIESIIKAPISGFLLNKAVEVGDPVIPLTSFQEGTVLMKMAAMENLLFKGTVDEIDVGKLKEGMDVEIKVGALPNDTIRGTLKTISLKADKKENATVFPIEITIPKSNKALLRAGYSANANIIIQKKSDVIMIPERVVTFRNDSAFVMRSVLKQQEEQYIETGLSDAISIEVKSGLNDSDEVFEKPVKKID